MRYKNAHKLETAAHALRSLDECEAAEQVRFPKQLDQETPPLVPMMQGRPYQPMLEAV